MSRHQTSTWQSSLYRNLFVALQVENPRRNEVVLDHLQFSPTSIGIKTQKLGEETYLGWKTKKKTETSIEQNSIYRCLFAALSVRKRRWDRGVLDSSGSPLVETTRDSTRRQWWCCMFLCPAKITCYWKVSNNPQPTTTTLEDWHDVVRICWKNWTAYQDGKDWRLYRGFQNCEESWIRRWLSIEKPQLFCLVRSCHNINCSNVFAKIDIHLPLKFVDQHLLDSRLVAPLRQIACNHRGIIQTRCEYHGGFLGPFLLNRCKSFKNWAEFVKDEVIDHFVARTSSKWRVIGIAWQNIDMARIADPRRVLTCQIIFVTDFIILHFVLGSNFIL